MSSPEVLPEQPVSSTSYESESDDDGDDFSTPSGPLPTIKTYDEDSSVAKLPGTALLRSVHNKPKNLSNHESVKSLQSDHTYNFDEKNDGDDSNVDEFGEDLAASPMPPSGKKQLGSSKLPGGKVPAWKLRQQQQQRANAPPKTLIESENGEDSDKVSPLRRAQKTRNAIRKNSPRTVRKARPENGNDGWLKKLTTKKETPEEKEKRIKSEALIEKQTSSRWGKDILEEDEEVSEELENKDNSKKEETGKEEDEEEDSDTIKKVKSLIEKSFGSALVSTIKKDKETQDDEKKDDEPPKREPPKREGRGNRWAMMGSVAMTSMRNVKKGLMGDDENDDEKKIDAETIAEEENEEDTVSDIKPDQNRRQAMWRNRGAAAFTSVRNAWGGGSEARRKELMNGDESSSHADDGLDSKSLHSDPGQVSLSDSNKNQEHNQNVFSHIGNFWNHTKARFDPEVWNDPEIKETLASIEKLRTKLNENRSEHRNKTRRREHQIENSISQQKKYLARRLARQMYNYRSNPFHPCIKEVYEKEILIIVHEVTNLGADDASESEKDGIDKLLDSERFDFDYSEEDEEEVDLNEGQDTLGAFFGKQKETGGEKKKGDNASVDGSLFSVDGSTIQITGNNSVVPLQTRLIRAQHNEMITDHQMELARSFQQKSIEHLYDVIPEMQKEHEKIKAIPQSALETKIKEMEDSNKKLKESYQAHVEAQEKLLTIYRERYVPSVHDEDDDGDEEKAKEANGEEEDGFKSAPSSPMKGAPIRPGMWAKNLGQSVRGLLGPKKDEDNEDNTANNNGSIDRDTSQGSTGGFDLPSPMTTGSNKKFLLSFGSPAGSKAASGILANFTSPLPLSTSKDDEETADKKSQQDSAKDSAAAAWTVPKMDKASLPESLAEKRAKRAAARRAARPDAAATTNGSLEVRKTTATASASRSELLQRARKARQESAAALGSSASAKHQPSSPTPSSRSGRSSLRSNTASTRKELSMKDLMEAAGDSRRKLQENDSRMERLTHKKNQLNKSSPLSSPTPSVTSSRAASRLSEERRLRIVRELRADDGLSMSSHHSLHERKPMGRSLKKVVDLEDDNEEPVHEEHLQDVDEFGGEAQ